MPELPEVEVTRKGIAPYLENRRISGAVVRCAKLRWPIPADLNTLLQGQKIHSIKRRAKYLLIECDAGTLMIHLGMSGSLRILENPLRIEDCPGRHDHFDLLVDGDIMLRLRDPRKFGSVLWLQGDIMQHPLLRNLGPEPLTGDFTGRRMHQFSRNRKTSIKAMLMDNTVVVGVGNIYANEALFQAGINPLRAIGRIGLDRYERLARNIKEVLERAIRAGGSTLRDFVGSDGNPGYFQQQYWVYGRAGLPCRNCDKIIKHIKQGQRSSFYCPACQR